MIGVSGQAIPDNFGVNLGSPVQGVGQLLQDHDAGPFSHDKTIPVLVEGTGGLFRFLVARGEGFHGVKPAYRQGSNRSLHPAGDDRVRFAPLDQPPGIPDIVVPCGAGGDHRSVGALGSESHGDLPGRFIDDEHGDEERGDPPGSPLEQDLVEGFEGGQAAQACPDHDSDPIRIGRRDLKLGVLHGLDRSSQGVLDEDIHPPDLFLIDEVLRDEVLHFGGDRGVKPLGVEFGDLAHAGFSLDERLPAFLHPDPQRRHHSHPGDHHSSTRHKTS